MQSQYPAGIVREKDNREPAYREGHMKLMPSGDHYLWYCEWCDTRNMTLWTSIERNQLCCTACQRKFPAFEETRPIGGGKGRCYQLL